MRHTSSGASSINERACRESGRDQGSRVPRPADQPPGRVPLGASIYRSFSSSHGEDDQVMMDEQTAPSPDIGAIAADLRAMFVRESEPEVAETHLAVMFQALVADEAAAVPERGFRSRRRGPALV